MRCVPASNRDVHLFQSCVLAHLSLFKFLFKAIPSKCSLVAGRPVAPLRQVAASRRFPPSEVLSSTCNIPRPFKASITVGFPSSGDSAPVNQTGVKIPSVPDLGAENRRLYQVSCPSVEWERPRTGIGVSYPTLIPFFHITFSLRLHSNICSGHQEAGESYGEVARPPAGFRAAGAYLFRHY